MHAILRRMFTSEKAFGFNCQWRVSVLYLCRSAYVDAKYVVIQWGTLCIGPTSLNNYSHYFSWSLLCFTVRPVILSANSMLNSSQ